MIEKRVSEASILRLIGSGSMSASIDDGRLLVSETGTGQGQVISPLLANIYLHHVLDEWFEDEVKPRLKGQGATKFVTPMMRYCAFSTARMRRECWRFFPSGLRSTV